MLGRKVLVLVLWVGIEHVEKGLFGEVWHLLLYRLCISDGVALREAELW